MAHVDLRSVFSTTPNRGTPRAIIYCRVSSPGQKENGSLEEQEARGRNWCEEHHYHVVGVYHEIYSGEDIDRPRLDDVRSEIRVGNVDVVVADKVDRFSRADPAITAYVMVEAQQYGCAIEFVEIQDDSFEGQILTAVLSIVARVEHKRIKERLNGGKRRRVLGDPAKGKPSRLLPGNMPRYGWKYRDEDKSAYDLEPTQAAIIERIYREIGEQGRTINAVCHDLNAEHIPPPTQAQVLAGNNVGNRRVSSLWNPSSIARMLRQPCYWGEPIAYRYEGFRREVKDVETNRIRKKKSTRYRALESDRIFRYSTALWPAIVSKELAEKAIARLEQNRVEATRNLKNPAHSFLRAGFILCRYCGANMVQHAHSAHGEPPVEYFVCGRHRAFRNRFRHPYVTEDCSAGGQFAIRVAQIEQTVWDFVVQALADPQLVPQAYQRLMQRDSAMEAERQHRIQVLDQLISEATTRRANYLIAIGQAIDDDVRRGLLGLSSEESAHIRTWQKERDQIEHQTVAQQEELNALQAFIAQINSQVVHMLQATTEERRKLAEALSIRVAVYRIQHETWFEMTSAVPGLIASWHGQQRHRQESLPIVDDTPRITNQVLRTAVLKWTAPVPTTPAVAEECPTATSASRG
ncbi:MAG TPA: recombinase family protein [Ktedonobacterales bacterium]